MQAIGTPIRLQVLRLGDSRQKLPQLNVCGACAHLPRLLHLTDVQLGSFAEPSDGIAMMSVSCDFALLLGGMPDLH
jgi:hypothetical protein